MNATMMKSCIDACIACAIECERCASACLKENDITTLIQCISLDRECAIVCNAAAHLMSVGGEHAHLLCGPCAAICDACAKECEKNSEFEHCRQCAEICRKCAQECSEMMEVSIS